MKRHKRPASLLTLAVISLCVFLIPLAARDANVSAPATPSPVLAAMETELTRSLAVLGKADPAAYFIRYTVSEQQRVEVQGSNGTLLDSKEQRARWLETQVRVGSYNEDNTRQVGERQGQASASAGAIAPLTDDPAGLAALRRSIWLETDRQYRSAAESLIKIRASRDVKVESAESKAPDFSVEKPQTSLAAPVTVSVDRKPWEEKVRRYTREFRKSATVLNSIVTFTANAENQFQISSEGTKLQFGDLHYRLELFIQCKAPDGMDINRYANLDWSDPAKTPGDETVLAIVKQMIAEAEALVAAPLVDPYAGPAMLTGRAAAVFFHEVFGHRAEGHRQKDITEGQTFTRKVGERIMPDFISIYDDPTKPDLKGTMLLGNYPYDDEGVPAQRVTLVEKGVLRNFLMSRQPLIGFPVSNGHGRRQVGYAPVSRQGNLLIESTKMMTNAQLRQALIAEVKRQGKPFGLLIDDIAGGFTFTGRGLPQAFQVIPLVVYKVYPDGRPDELVRGVDLVGTPLASLDKIVATGDTPEIFNGYCGAESGSVPVAAASPAILISELEIQKKETSTDKPPILPHPLHDKAGK